MDRNLIAHRAGRYWSALAFAAVLLLSGCEQDTPWKLRDISGLMPDLQFTLVDSNGKQVDANRFRGKVVLLYFGYTHCPDVCPTTLAKLAKAVATLGADADRVRVLFVSVDPRRDVPARLGDYARYFGPQVVGVSGREKDLRALTKRYRVTYGLDKPDPEGNYEVAHSSAVFIFDAKGKVRLLATSQDSGDAIAADLQRMVAAS